MIMSLQARRAPPGNTNTNTNTNAGANMSRNTLNTLLNESARTPFVHRSAYDVPHTNNAGGSGGGSAMGHGYEAPYAPPPAGPGVGAAGQPLSPDPAPSSVATNAHDAHRTAAL